MLANCMMYIILYNLLQSKHSECSKCYQNWDWACFCLQFVLLFNNWPYVRGKSDKKRRDDSIWGRIHEDGFCDARVYSILLDFIQSSCGIWFNESRWIIGWNWGLFLWSLRSPVWASIQVWSVGCCDTLCVGRILGCSRKKVCPGELYP